MQLAELVWSAASLDFLGRREAVLIQSSLLLSAETIILGTLCKSLRDSFSSIVGRKAYSTPPPSPVGLLRAASFNLF